MNTDKELSRVLTSESHNGNNPEIQISPQSPAYLIYTSGTTGRPKGVIISHSAVSNLVKSEHRIFQAAPADRVAQGFSVAFDASVEEIWLAWLSGATLFPVPEKIMLSGIDLAAFITRKQISVLSTVPTLLSMMSPPLQSLRILILGGEYCPQGLLQKWHRKGLRIVNTYGPTEATVITTYSECNSHEKNDIGRPIDNCAVFITDPVMRPVPVGVPGELCIGGEGLSSGYLNRDDLTSEKFVTPPFVLRSGFPGRVYRSGDLARWNERGQLEFLGRLDLQVKIRGYRIELREIESQILQIPNIQNAVVAVKKDRHEVMRLVAYVVLNSQTATFDESVCKRSLRSKLAPYMIPDLFMKMTDLPKLPSGKIDRHKLPEPEFAFITDDSPLMPPKNAVQQHLYEVWKEYFSPHSVSVTDDFFLDLGGHSLLAARVVSRLRRKEGFHNISIGDIYQYPTIEKLAQKIYSVQQQAEPVSIHHRQLNKSYHASRLKYFCCGLLQLPALYLLFGIDALMEVISFLVFFVLRSNNDPMITSITWALIAGMAVYPCLVFTAVLLKWLLLGRIKPGSHRLWSWYYIRWWFVQNLVGVLDLDNLAGTPLLPFVLRLLGMQIGKNVHLETDGFGAFDLVTIGEGTSADEDASLSAYKVENGHLLIGPIRIGRNCFIGTRSVVCPNTVLEDGARLEDLSLLPSGSHIPFHETWSGSPAQPIQYIPPEMPQPPQRTLLHRISIVWLYGVLTFLIPLVFLIPFVPGIVFLMQLSFFENPLLYLLVLPVVGASFVLLLTGEVSIIKWLLVGRVRPGVYATHSSFYIRNWIVDQLLKMSLDYIGQLHATLYVIPWYRSLGTRLGKFVELSTASSTTPDLLSLNTGSTIADEVSLGSPHIEGGWMTLAPTRLGSRSFIGNSAVIPAGTEIGDNSLVGVLSIAPQKAEAKNNGATWFGSPPILFPRRQHDTVFPDENTYLPKKKLQLARGSFELLRVTLPPAGFIFVAVFVIITALRLLDYMSIGTTLMLLPAVYIVGCAVVLLCVVLIKWVVMGRYRPFVHPLWSFFVWRLEFVNALYEFLVSPLALDKLGGTPFLAWYLRLLGAKIGRRCFIDTTGFLEWDLVEIGDNVALGEDCILQTHLFEDRVLKASSLHIGSDCTIGPFGVVLYNSVMEDGSSIDGLSLLMKGETILAGTKWAGCPAKFVPS